MGMDVPELKRICVYCDTWGQGGIEAFISETLLHMDMEGLSFRLVCAEKTASRFDVRLAERGLCVQPLLAGQGASALAKTLKSVVPLARLCRREGIEIVHLNVFHGVSLVQALVLKLCGVERVIVHCHGAGLRKSRGGAVKSLGHAIFRRLLRRVPDERWAASRPAARFLFGTDEVQIVPNGIETVRFRFDSEKRLALRRELGAGDRLVLGCVGRLDAQKNQRFLLTLLAAIEHRGGSALLLLIGDGEERPALERYAVELGIRGDTVFHGVSGCVGDWMCAMDLLLIPSTSEGLSIAAIEGQASGLPVLCSTGVPEEVRLSGLVRFLPLSDMGRWIDAVDDRPACDRVEMNARIRGSGYDIRDAAAMVRALYLSGRPDAVGEKITEGERRAPSSCGSGQKIS